MEQQQQPDKSCSTSHVSSLLRALPKADLHRHLTGSLPRTQVQAKLAQSHPALANSALLVTPTWGPGEEEAKMAWELLKRQCEAVTLATAEAEQLEELVAGAVADLASDNVLYCEFRVGLKPQPSKREYLLRLVKVIRAQKKVWPEVTVKLLVSVARHGDVEYGRESVAIAIDFFNKIAPDVVCGVEMGGVATCGTWSDFAPLFEEARAAGLPVALHCGENVDNQTEPAEMIAWHPDRLGHCVFINEENVRKLSESRIPLETCLTCHARCYQTPVESNILTKLPADYPVALCTDNPSFYEVSLSDEYISACEHLGASPSDLARRSLQTLQYAFFRSEADREAMQALFQTRIDALKLSDECHC